MGREIHETEHDRFRRLERLFVLLQVYEGLHHLREARDSGKLQIDQKRWNELRNLWMDLEADK